MANGFVEDASFFFIIKNSRLFVVKGDGDVNSFYDGILNTDIDSFSKVKVGSILTSYFKVFSYVDVTGLKDIVFFLCSGVVKLV